MEFLYFLEKLRFPLLDNFMLLITRLGEETAFLVVALIIFWCVDKRRGYYVLVVGFLGTLANQFLKLLCRVPRPWVLDENFTILEQAREAASGYSFPSGHSQSSVGTFGAIAATTQKPWLRWGSIAICVLVPLSRMYIGVHTPADVLLGSGMAVALLLVLKPVMLKSGEKWIPRMLLVTGACTVAYLGYVELFPFPADIDAHNYASALKNAYTLLGCIAGLLLAYVADEKKLHFPVKAVWWAQALKVLLGLVVVLAVKEGLRSPLEAVFSNVLLARCVRYFLIVIAAGILWPMSFAWFARLGKKGE